MSAGELAREEQLETQYGNTRLGTVRNQLRSIQLDFEPQTELRLALSELRQTAIASRGKPQPAVCALADSFSGKSRGLEVFAKEVNDDPANPPGAIPIPIVRLDPEGSLGSTATDILRALGERRPDRGTPAFRWERARHAIRQKQVQVLSFDEFQRANRRPTLSAVIAYKIQDIIDSGDCAAAFVGKRDAGDIFKMCPDLGNRLDAPVRMPPLSWASADDRRIFVRFLQEYDEELVRLGITKASSGFALDATPQLLLEASGGLIGCFCRIVETAALAITRNDQPAISYDDLEQAVDDWAIGNRRIDYNPFRKAAL